MDIEKLRKLVKKNGLKLHLKGIHCVSGEDCYVVCPPGCPFSCCGGKCVGACCANACRSTGKGPHYK